MKYIKNLFIILTCFSMNILMPIARGGKQQPATAPSIKQEIAAAVSQIAQKKSFKQLLEEAKSKDNAVDDNGRLTPQFIVWAMSNAIASNLDPIMTQMLLQAGISYYGQFEDVKGPGSIARLAPIEEAIGTHARQYPTMLAKYAKEVKATIEIPTFTPTQEKSLILYLSSTIEALKELLKEAIDAKDQDTLITGLKTVIEGVKGQFGNEIIISKLKQVLGQKMQLTPEQTSFINDAISKITGVITEKTLSPLTAYITTAIQANEQELKNAIAKHQFNFLTELFKNIIYSARVDLQMPRNLPIIQELKQTLKNKIQMDSEKIRLIDDAISNAANLVGNMTFPKTKPTPLKLGLKITTEESETVVPSQTGTKPAMGSSERFKNDISEIVNDYSDKIQKFSNKNEEASLIGIFQEMIKQIREDYPLATHDMIISGIMDIIKSQKILNADQIPVAERVVRNTTNMSFAKPSQPKTQPQSRTQPIEEEIITELPMPTRQPKGTQSQPAAPYQSTVIQPLGSEQKTQATLETRVEELLKNAPSITTFGTTEQEEWKKYLEGMNRTLKQEFPNKKPGDIASEIFTKLTDGTLGKLVPTSITILKRILNEATGNVAREMPMTFIY